MRTSLEAELWALEKGLKYCVVENCLPVVLETDSLMAFKCLSGNWEIPWSVRMKICRINELRSLRRVQVQHILREGNKVADFFAKLVFCFAGTKQINFQSIQQVPRQGRALISMDAQRIPNVRIIKMQNHSYNTGCSR